MKRHLIAIFLLAISITFVVGAQEKQAEATEKDALDAISQAELDIREMSERGFGVVYVNDRLTEARNALLVGGKDNYALVLVKAKEISNRKDRAYGISDSLRALKLRIEELSGRRLDTAKAEEIYIASMGAFRKENYDEAEELVFQANKNLSDVEAEHTVLKARYNAARDNTISYLKEHWRGLSAALVLLLVIGLISYDKFDSIKTRQRLDDMEMEKKVLVEEMKKAQIDYFNKGAMSRESYDIKMRKYREMRVKIEESIPLLRTRLEKGVVEGLLEKKVLKRPVTTEEAVGVEVGEGVPEVEEVKPVSEIPMALDEEKTLSLKSSLDRLNIRKEVIKSILNKLNKKYKEGSINKTMYNRIKKRNESELKGYLKEIKKIESELKGKKA